VAEKLPWFPYYVYRYQTDELAMVMTLEAEGIYHALLRHQWIHGSVPADEDALRRLLKPHAPESLAMVLPCFPPHRSDASRRFNRRLEEIREEQSGKRARLAKAGRQGGLASGVARRSVAEASLEASVQHRRSRPSTSLGSTEAGTPQGTEEQPQSPGTALVVRQPFLPFDDQSQAAAVRQKTAIRQTKERTLKLAAATIFTYWRDVMHRPDAILDRKREARIIARLRENGANVSELLYVVDGASRDDWTMGRDPRSSKPYNGTETIFKNREKCEAFLALVKRREEMHPYLQAPTEGTDGAG